MQDAVNWVAVYNRLFRIIDGTDAQADGRYYSGPRFIELVQECGYDCSNYGDFIRGRGEYDMSTSRRDYFKDLFLAMKEPQRRTLVLHIVRECEGLKKSQCDEIRSLLGGGTLAPQASVPVTAWNGDRLNEYLRDMDEAIATKKYELTITLAYTCMEGFFKAFMSVNMPFDDPPRDIIDLAKEVKWWLKHEHGDTYPDEVINLVTQSAHALNRTRDGFSASHFGEEAELWLATYMRDLVNTQIRLLLHFM
jgi:hypothetical protein